MTPEQWFAARGWTPFAFQQEVWAAMADGRSGLLHATTGAGKTYAVWFGALLRALRQAGPSAPAAKPGAPAAKTGASCAKAGSSGARARAPGAKTDAAVERRPARARAASTPELAVLWVTPMRALAADTVRALEQPLADLAPCWTVGLRSGDTPSAERVRQDRRYPSTLVTTPESLTLLLTREDAATRLAGIGTVVVDEWHELIGNKRGAQVQLALARLRRWNPGLAVWGLSATLGNLDEAMAELTAGAPATLVRGRIDKSLVIDTLIPHEPGRFSWAGHLGAQMQPAVIREIESATTTIVFTNVRSQSEIWYQLLLQARPDWAGVVALHHGSLDKETRAWVEQGLKAGTLKAVVATSSLDLGVDFLPVERVLQIGSAKGVARMLQRAGRSGHAPGRPSRITLVPTNTLELVEAAAARRAARAGRVEPRHAPRKPLDVLVQHLVTVALGGGFTPAELLEEVRSAPCYRSLTAEEFQWALDFVVQGGASLGAYPEYHRVRLVDGVYRVTDRGIALRHRLSVGTITSDATMTVAWLTGGRLGTMEEGFISRLRPGDCFVFGGRLLEYVRTRDLVAYVRKAEKRKGAVPAWNGSKMPLSTEMCDTVLELIGEAAGGKYADPELQAAAPMLETQARLSRLPVAGRLLIERFRSREGRHLFMFPFAGRNVHLGLGSLLAWRLARDAPNTFSISVNDYGFELLSAIDVDPGPLVDGRAYAADGLMADVLASLNSSRLAERRFREIARVAGLVFAGYPGAPKSTRQLQASSGLFYEVFRKYDAGNLLLTQAEGEVLSQELDLEHLSASLARMRAQPVEFVELATPSPFSLPLLVERFREQLTTEKLQDRLDRLLRDMELAADAAPPAGRPGRRRGATGKTRSGSKSA